MVKFRRCFGRMGDPRAANARHDLLELLVIALAATLCGAESCADMADFGQAKKRLLRLFLRLEHGVPSHDTGWLPRGAVSAIDECGRGAFGLVKGGLDHAVVGR
jgi:hypothetical protein